MSSKPADKAHAEPHPDGCQFAICSINLLINGTWTISELPEVLDTLVLLSRAETTDAEVARELTRTTGVTRGRGYVRSVRTRSAQTLHRHQGEEQWRRTA